MTNANRCRGLTLLELLVVLAILIALATLLVPMVSFLGQRSQGSPFTTLQDRNERDFVLF